jgi:hypothetical protein
VVETHDLRLGLVGDHRHPRLRRRSLRAAWCASGAHAMAGAAAVSGTAECTRKVKARQASAHGPARPHCPGKLNIGPDIEESVTRNLLPRGLVACAQGSGLSSSVRPSTTGCCGSWQGG